MKRQFLWSVLVSVLLLALALPVFAAGQYIYDQYGLLSETEKQDLQDRAEKISSEYDCGVYIVVIADYGEYGRSVEDAAENIYTANRFGLYEDDSGILLLLSMQDRDYDLYSRGFGTYALGSSEKAALQNAFLDNFSRDDWYGGFSDFLDESGGVLNRAVRYWQSTDPYSRENYHSGPGLGSCVLIGLIAGFLIAFIVCGVLKAKMRSVHSAAGAAAYAASGGINLYESADAFSHITESRVRIESDSDRSSGGGGGGGRPSGGGSHSSGKF